MAVLWLGGGLVAAMWYHYGGDMDGRRQHGGLGGLGMACGD